MMKKRLASSVFPLLVAGTLATGAGAVNEPLTPEEREIRSLEDQEVAAVLDADIAALERLWSPQFIVNNPQNGITADRADVIDRVRRGLISYSSFERRIEAIRFAGDVAIVMGSEAVVPKGDSAREGQTLHRRYTSVWKRSGSGWQNVARHANLICPR
jgi:ketosteroid isomerase-like protein